MKRRLLNLPLMKGLLDVLPVGLSPPLLHLAMPPLPSFCQKPPRRTTPPDEVCEFGELVHLSEPPVGRLQPTQRFALLLKHEQLFVRNCKHRPVMCTVRCPEGVLHPIRESHRPLRESVPAPYPADTHNHERQDLKNRIPLIGGSVAWLREEVRLCQKPQAARAIVQVYLM
jgi:hypothetical protein